MQDRDDAFANMAHVPGSEALPGQWTARAAAFRAETAVETHAYGPAERETFDLVLPDGRPEGLAVFVHGGYWMKFAPALWTHLAAGARARGWAVCLPGYTLAPEARIGAMTQQIGRAIAAAAERVPGPIRLAGHSAGGHLVSRMVCEDTPLPPAVLDRVEHTLSISGLHDLRPLMWTAMNATLGLDETEARAESAALLRPAGRPRLTAWVGGGERPEFIRQAQLIALIWAGLGAETRCEVEGSHNHFTVVDALEDAESPLTRAFLG